MAEAGATVSEVQQAGRWQGPTMPARYVREMPEASDGGQSTPNFGGGMSQIDLSLKDIGEEGVHSC